MSTNVTNIRTSNGELRIWESRPGHFAWATPNGSEGGDEASFDDAVKEAFAAEDLIASEYGY
jgi:hypothetical protein